MSTITMWKAAVLVCYGVNGNECVPQNATDVLKGAFEPAFNQQTCATYALFPMAKVAESMHITLKDGAVLRVICEAYQVDARVVAESLRAETAPQ